MLKLPVTSHRQYCKEVNDISPLQSVKNLQELTLTETDVDVEQFSYLKSLKNLKQLAVQTELQDTADNLLQEISKEREGQKSNYFFKKTTTITNNQKNMDDSFKEHLVAVLHRQNFEQEFRKFFSTLRWLTREEVNRLLHELPKHLKDVVVFTLATGLRKSNVLGLQWANVDLNNKHA